VQDLPSEGSKEPSTTASEAKPTQDAPATNGAPTINGVHPEVSEEKPQPAKPVIPNPYEVEESAPPKKSAEPSSAEGKKDEDEEGLEFGGDEDDGGLDFN